MAIDPTNPQQPVDSTSLEAMQKTIKGLLEQIGRIDSATRKYNTTTRDLNLELELMGFKTDEAKKSILGLIEANAQSAMSYSSARRGLEQMSQALRSMGVAPEKLAAGMDLFGRRLNSVSKEFDLGTMTITDFKRKLAGGMISMNELAKQATGNFTSMRYGWAGVGLDLAKGIENIDIQTRRATIGMMGIGQGRVGGAAGFGGVRAYQATDELREASGKTIANLILMGRTSTQAADEVLAMTRVFGANFNNMGTSLVMKAAEVSAAFATVANVSQDVAQAATINLIQRFGMSANKAGATLMGFENGAKAAGMSTNMYTSLVTELSQSTVNYTKEVSFSEAIVRKFGKELISGVMSIQQFSQMAGAMRQADFGRQAGIYALAQQMNVRTPNIPRNMSPLGAIGMMGGKDPAALLELQVNTMKALANQITPAGATSEEKMGAMRLTMQEFPALKSLQSLSNESLNNIVDGVNDLAKMQAEIKKAGGKDPAEQTADLIGFAKDTSLSTRAIADALKAVSEATAFRVTLFGGGGGAKEEAFAAKTKYRSAELSDLREKAAHGDVESQVKLKKIQSVLHEESERTQKEKISLSKIMPPEIANQEALRRQQERMGVPEKKFMANPVSNTMDIAKFTLIPNLPNITTPVAPAQRQTTTSTSTRQPVQGSQSGGQGTTVNVNVTSTGGNPEALIEAVVMALRKKFQFSQATDRGSN
jgi:hypothetical protein